MQLSFFSFVNCLVEWSTAEKHLRVLLNAKILAKAASLNKCGQLPIRHRIRDNAQGFLKAIEEECQRL